MLIYQRATITYDNELWDLEGTLFSDNPPVFSPWPRMFLVWWPTLPLHAWRSTLGQPHDSIQFIDVFLAYLSIS